MAADPGAEGATPPRNLSGPRTARGRRLWRATAALLDDEAGVAVRRRGKPGCESGESLRCPVTGRRQRGRAVRPARDQSPNPDPRGRLVTPHPAPSLYDLEHGLPFLDRHVGPRDGELATMLATIGVASLDELAD